MGKLAIVTGYHIINYGSVLQAYATQKFITDMNIENECVFYEKKKDINQILRIFNLPLLKTKIDHLKKKLYSKLNYEKFGKNFDIRNKIFNDFIKNNFKTSKRYYGYENLKEGIKEYDMVLLGSDQVWNPLNFGSHYYTLEFVPDNIKKVAYSPSFGVSKIPQNQLKATKKYLERIECISVREKQGQNIIKELTGRTAPIVVDPTLLLDIKQWKEIYSENRLVKEKYIFCYFLGTNPKHRKFANDLKTKTGYTIVTLPYMDEIVKGDFDFADKQLFEAGPSEFLNLVCNAEFVCTDSFHGTIFSIVHHKNFFTFRRHEEKKGSSTNSRLDSLLDLLDIKERLCDSDIKIENIIDNEIDYKVVDENLEKIRQSSKEYLYKSLNEINK